jgi:hypothetical protein
MASTADKELKEIRDYYYNKWCNLPDNLTDYDDLIIDLLNEIEDLYNPGRLNGN